jgi:peptide/nickel transport system substrate-binding protein
MPGYSPIPARLPYDPEKARDILAHLGYGSENPAPVCTLFTNPSSDPNDRFDRYIIEDLEAVGIELLVELLDWTELDSGMQDGSLGMFAIGWVADLPDPDSFFHFLFHTKGDNNIFGFSDPTVDRLIEEARVARGGQRWEIYRRLEGLILSQAPIVPLNNTYQLTAWQPYVEGVQPSLLGTPMMELERVRIVRKKGPLKAQVEGRKP